MTKYICNSVLTVLISIVFLVCTTLAFAAPKVTVKTDYYDVHGANLKEVRKSIEKHSSMTHNFGNRDALTDYNVMPKWGNPPTVTLVITYIMPRWVECDKAPKNIQKKWHDYIDSVQFHENGHEKIARELAIAVEKKMIAEGPRPGRTANRDISKIYQEYGKKQLAYDKETKHGQTQNPVILD